MSSISNAFHAHPGNILPVTPYEYYQEGSLDSRYTMMWGDQYALTMSQGFYTNNKHNTIATFHAYQRSMPLGGSYIVTGGQNIIFEWLKNNWRLDDVDIHMMRAKKVLNPETGQMERIYTDEFIEFIRTEPFRCTIDAMPEGELAFADEPIYRVHGPLWQCLMVEAAILNVTNSQSLFATLASHLVKLTGGAPILEFGLRRTQCIGGLEPSRGAWLGGGSPIPGGGLIGITGTSNMLADKFYGIPSVGTMAHAFIMTYEDELEAFADYAKAMPYNGVFLVDTYSTTQGIKNAIDTCKKYNIKLKGIRLDSGDMVYLSNEARRMLDEAGFNDTKIIASDGLTYKEITRLKAENAPIDVFAIGGYLVNSPDQVSLGPVYKLGGIFNSNLTQHEIDHMRGLAQSGTLLAANDTYMRKVIKMSEVPGKVTIPGELDVLRYIFTDKATGQKRFDGDTIIPYWGQPHLDAVNNRTAVLNRDVVSVLRQDDTRKKTFRVGTQAYRPLQRYFTHGQMIQSLETVHHGRARATASLAMLEASHKGMPTANPYRVGIEEGLYEERKIMMGNIYKKIQALKAA